MAIALYARKSVEREGSISCETQIEYCRRRLAPCEEQETLLTYIDNGCSGGNTDRAAFQKMMRGVEGGSISKIIIYRLDRISRSLSDFVGILNVCKAHRVALVSTQESFDTSSPYGDMVVKILMVFAEFERNSIISRVTQAYAHRSACGFYMGGRRPYGFSLEETVLGGVKTKMLCPHPKEAVIIPFLFDTYATGNMTLGKLRDALAGKDPHKSWSTAKLSTILKNPIYVRADSRIYDYFFEKHTEIVSAPVCFDGMHGLQLYGKVKHGKRSTDLSDIKAVVMPHEGLVDSRVWLACQAKLARNRQMRNAVSNAASFLGGKVKCGVCGRTMTTVKGQAGKNGTRIYFSCTGKTHTKTCVGIQTTVYAACLEDAVTRSVAELLSGMSGAIMQPTDGQDPLCNVLQNKLHTVQLQEERLAMTVANQEIGAELLAVCSRKAEALQKERAEITARLRTLFEKKSRMATEIALAEQWSHADFEKKRAVCAILIEKLVVLENGDLEIVWRV